MFKFLAILCVRKLIESKIILYLLSHLHTEIKRFAQFKYLKNVYRGLLWIFEKYGCFINRAQESVDHKRMIYVFYSNYGPGLYALKTILHSTLNCI